MYIYTHIFFCIHEHIYIWLNLFEYTCIGVVESRPISRIQLKRPSPGPTTKAQPKKKAVEIKEDLGLWWCAYMYACIYICLCMHVFIYAYVYIYTYIHTYT
jgi:hypothetical protein